MSQPESLSPTQIVAARVKQFRTAHGWSARELAERCAEAGAPHLERSILANLENGRRKTVTIDEVLVLAWVLGVPAAMLFIPLGTEHEIAITSEIVMHPHLAFRWLVGDEEPPTSERLVAGHVDSALFNRAAQPIRLYDRLSEVQDALGRAERDLAWAKDAGKADQAKAAEQRRDEALQRLADVLDDMVTMGVLPPAIWHERYDRMRAAGYLRNPDSIERWTEET